MFTLAERQSIFFVLAWRTQLYLQMVPNFVGQYFPKDEKQTGQKHLFLISGQTREKPKFEEANEECFVSLSAADFGAISFCDVEDCGGPCRQKETRPLNCQRTRNQQWGARLAAKVKNWTCLNICWLSGPPRHESLRHEKNKMRQRKRKVMETCSTGRFELGLMKTNTVVLLCETRDHVGRSLMLILIVCLPLSAALLNAEFKVRKVVASALDRSQCKDLRRIWRMLA